MAGNRFPRDYHLKRRRLIRALFDKSRSDVGFIHVGVAQIRYRVVPRSEVGADVPVQIGFAPGSRMRTKVIRNRVRRVMRETFRNHQKGLVDLFILQSDCLTLMVLFRGHEDTADDELRRDFPEALKRLEDRLTDTT